MYSPRIELEPTIFINGPLMWLGLGALLAGLFMLARRRPDYGLAAVVATMPLYQVRGHLGIPFTLLELVLGTVLLAIVTQWPKFKPIHTKFDWWVVAYVAVSLVAVLVGPDVREGFGLWRAFFLEPALFFVAAVSVFKHYQPKALLVGAVGAVAVLALWTGSLLLDGRAIAYDDRLLGPYQSPNYFALLLGPLLLMITTWPKKELLALRIAALAAGLTMLAATNSRGGQLALVAGLAVALLLVKGKLRQYGVALLLTLLVVGGAVLGPGLFRHSENQVVQSRPVIWKEALGIVADHPVFGNGPGQFQDVFRERIKDNQDYMLYVAPQALNPHNVWLVTWVEWGLATLLVFIGIVVQLARTIIRRLSYWQIVPVTMLTAILIHGEVDTSVLKNDLAILFWLVVTLSLVVPQVKAKRVG